MRETLAQIPTDLFYTAVVAFALGVLAAWRFARALERVREAINRGRHYFDTSINYFRFARQNLVALAVATLFMVSVLGVVGYAVFLRATA